MEYQLLTSKSRPGIELFTLDSSSEVGAPQTKLFHPPFFPMLASFQSIGRASVGHQLDWPNTLTTPNSDCHPGTLDSWNWKDESLLMRPTRSWCLVAVSGHDDIPTTRLTNPKSHDHQGLLKRSLLNEGLLRQYSMSWIVPRFEEKERQVECTFSSNLFDHNKDMADEICWVTTIHHRVL